jgi:hypothetical protein
METTGEVSRNTTDYRDYTISVTTERMRDSTWAVVARAVHRTQTADDIFPVPVPDRRFATEQEALELGFQAARDWIDANSPRQGG